jgi:iron complex outermembrane recepter protein
MNRFVIANILCAAAGLLGAGNAVVAEEAEQEGLNIEAQPLSSALREFSEQTGLQIGYAAELAEGKETAGVVGLDDPDAALDALLAQSELEHRFVNTETVVIRAAAATPAETRRSSDSGNAQATLSQVLMAKASQAKPGQSTSPSSNRVQGSERNGELQRGDGGLALEEIIVTARRREEQLKDIPSSITVFGSEELVRSNIRDIKDYFAKTPNVSFTESGTRAEREISIRGVSNIGGHTSALAFYVDEFNIINGPQTQNVPNSNSSINPQLIDVERIEVLRGPQGTYFGRNATGGAINITTMKPQPDFHAETGAGYGRLNTRQLSGIVNVPIVSERLFFRGSVSYEESDGFVKNVNPVGGRSDTEFQNYRGALRLLPTNSMLVDLTVNYTKEEQGLPQLIPNGMVSPASASLSGAAGFPSGIIEGPLYPGNRRHVNLDLRERQQNEFLTAVGRIEIDAGWATVTSVTGYLDTRFQSEDNDLDGSSFGFLEQNRDVTTDSFSQEIRLSGESGSGRADWLLGGIYAEDNKNQVYSVAAGPDGLLGLPLGFPFDAGDRTFNTQSWAVFGEATWYLTEKLTLTAGGRYSDDTVSQRRTGVNFGAPTVPTEGKTSFDDFSPRVAATYALNDSLTYYAAVSKGYKAGGLQLNNNQLLPVSEFKEETIWNYEGGLKLATMGGRLRSNLAVFYMDWSDLQVFTSQPIVDPVTGQVIFLHVTKNAASATNKGLEFDLRALPTRNFEIGGSVGYLHARFDDFPDAVVMGNTVDLSDREIPRSPKWTASIDAEYRKQMADIGEILSPLGEGYLRAEWSYRSRSVPLLDSLVPNPQQLVSDQFELLNIRAGFVTDTYRLDAYVENVLDEVYFTTFWGFGFSGARINPTYRSYGIKFKYYFN